MVEISANGTSFSGNGLRGSETDELEPIAIIGLSLRFPAGATSAATFWDIMMQGKPIQKDFPPERFNVEAWHRPGKSPRGGAFVTEDVDRFDAPFFSMTPAEAECLDPLQRWLLETSYEAFENAGLSMKDVAGSKASVHVGSNYHEWEVMMSRDLDMGARHKATGTAASMLANRISWFFDLTGPSISVDTACSSSLYALHLAVQSLRSGESEMGLVAGCHLILQPDSLTALSELSMLSPTSTCYSFDSRANGFMRGEGFGVLILKPLKFALRDNNAIRAVIRASGVNQDGKTAVITQPSSMAQRDLIKETYKKSGLVLDRTGFFEAHATGTPIGDPAEAKAIGEAFKDCSREAPLVVGAMKSMFGHLEGASGVASVIKSVLILERGLIPPNIWFETAHPSILAEEWRLNFPTKSMNWPAEGLRRASCNSFGFGGANAHVILDDAYHYLSSRSLTGNHYTIPSSLENTSSKSLNGVSQALNPFTNGLESIKSHPCVFALSAADEVGITRLTEAYTKHLQPLCSSSAPGSTFIDLAYTLSAKRTRLPWKSFIMADSMSDLLTQLESNRRKPRRSTKPPPIGFVFGGQGAQWHAMGRELLAYDTFRAAMKSANEYFVELGCTWSVLDEMEKDASKSRIDLPELSQPICTALQIALVDLLREWNIKPVCVVGHSSGEIAAAYCVGALSRESALRVAYFRGITAATIKDRTNVKMGMMAVGLSEPLMRDYIVQKQVQDVAIACINSPGSVTLSGSLESIETLESCLTTDKKFARKLNVDIAYHSSFMGAATADYENWLGTLQTDKSYKGDRPITISSVIAGEIAQSELLKASYWSLNMNSAVRFSDAILTASRVEAGMLGKTTQIAHWLEVSPHSTLRGPLREILSSVPEQSQIEYSSMLTRSVPATKTALETAGELYCAGHNIDISAVNRLHPASAHARMLTDLPPYPFNHSKSYWIESRISRNHRFRQYAYHSLLGTQVEDWNPFQPRWKNYLSLESHPWVEDHKINGMAVFPAAGVLVAVMEAARQLNGDKVPILAYRLRNVKITSAVILRSNEVRIETQVCLQPSREHSRSFLSWTHFQFFIYENDDWVETCSGAIALDLETDTDNVSSRAEEPEIAADVKNAQQRCSSAVGAGVLYDCIKRSGITYGPLFATLQRIQCNADGESTATVDLQKWCSEMTAVQKEDKPSIVHPAALDTLLQLGLSALVKGGKETIPTLVPSSFKELWVSAITSPAEEDGARLVEAYAKGEWQGLRNCEVSFKAVDKLTGRARFYGTFGGTCVDKDTANELGASKEPVAYEITWKPDVDILTSTELVSYCKSHADLNNISPPTDAIELKKTLYCNIRLWQLRDCLPTLGPLQETGILQKYRQWAEYRLHEENIRPHNREELKNMAQDECQVQELEDCLETCDPEGRALVRVGKELQRIFSGSVGILEILFGDKTLLNDYYQYGNTASPVVPFSQVYMQLHAHKNPGLKILEIGAGTGGTTRAIIGTLIDRSHSDIIYPKFESYTFTDISPSFFGEAKTLFEEVEDRMEFVALDISQDPIEQGFEEAHYDIILAANVIHATPGIKSSLENAHKLLKPGGKLILYELTNPYSERPGFIFGLLDGWWLGEEEHRKLSPLMNTEQWNEYLLASGFSGVDSTFEDKKVSANFSALISTKNLHAPQQNGTNGTPSEQSFIIYSDASSTQREIADKISSSASGSWLEASKIPMSQIEDVDFEKASIVFLPEMERPILYDVSSKDFDRLQKMICSSKRILWVKVNTEDLNDNSAKSMVEGFRNGVVRELPDLSFATLAISAAQSLSECVSPICIVMERLSHVKASNHDVMDMEYRFIGGVLCVHRVVPSTSMNNFLSQDENSNELVTTAFRTEDPRPLKLTMSTLGSIDTLHFTDNSQLAHELGPHEIEIEVHAVGLNFKDVLMAMGKVPDFNLGAECAGYVTRTNSESPFNKGDRVCTLTQGSFATSIRSDWRCVTRIADDMKWETAAAIPAVFCTAFYTLNHLARIQQGDSILIHSAAGGLGQALIQLARLHDAKIFATAGSQEKKEFLVRHCGIPAEHIFSSRTPEFVTGIKRLTGGSGVDIVVNHLTGEGLRNSLECVANLGRFIEVGRKDISQNSALEMGVFSRGITVAAVDIGFMIDNAPIVIGSLLKSVMDLFQSGQIFVAMPLHSFPVSNIQDAVRLLQSGTVQGKIVVSTGSDDAVTATPDRRPRSRFQPDASYVVVGGFGGLGRSIIQWMTARGAKYLIILSRGGMSDVSSKRFVEQLQEQGVSVTAPACDITDEDTLRLVLAECERTIPLIKGCIHGAMAQEFCIFSEMTHSGFRTVTAAKVQGSWNLHKALPPDMDFFVMLSSSTGLGGSHGQVNYTAASTYQDTLAIELASTGQRPETVALDIGPVDSVGFAFEKGWIQRLRSWGWAVITEGQFHRILDFYCDPAREPKTPNFAQVATGFHTPGWLKSEAIEIPRWMQRPPFSHVLHIRSPAESRTQSRDSAQDYGARISALVSPAGVAPILIEAIRTKLANMLAVDVTEIDAGQRPTSYGVDSLGATEVRIWMQKTLGCDVPVLEILGNMSIEMLARRMVCGCRFVPGVMRSEMGG